MSHNRPEVHIEWLPAEKGGMWSAIVGDPTNPQYSIVRRSREMALYELAKLMAERLYGIHTETNRKAMA